MLKLYEIEAYNDDYDPLYDCSMYGSYPQQYFRFEYVYIWIIADDKEEALKGARLLEIRDEYKITKTLDIYVK